MSRRRTMDSDASHLLVAPNRMDLERLLAAKRQQVQAVVRRLPKKRS